MRGVGDIRAPVIVRRLSGPPPETGNFSGRLLHAMVPLKPRLLPSSRYRCSDTTLALPVPALAHATPPRRSANRNNSTCVYNGSILASSSDRARAISLLIAPCILPERSPRRLTTHSPSQPISPCRHSTRPPQFHRPGPFQSATSIPLLPPPPSHPSTSLSSPATVSFAPLLTTPLEITVPIFGGISQRPGTWTSSSRCRSSLFDINLVN